MDSRGLEARANGGAAGPEADRFRTARSGHRPPRLRCVCGRQRGGEGHERHADADRQEIDRHDVSAVRQRERRKRIRSRHPRTARPRARGEAAVLQESDMTYPSNFKYTKDHEWIDIAGDRAKVGITDYAQKQLGDVVFVELPSVGTKVAQGQAFGTIEAVKAVSELYSPVAGGGVSG